MRGFVQRVVVGVIGTVLLGMIAACPPSKPPPVTPDASDASPAPAPIAVVTCDAACARAVAVCPSVVPAICGELCNRIGRPFAVKLLAANGCPDVKAAGK
jgi:hypothetical protein